MRIIDIVGNAVAQLDTDIPFTFMFGADDSDANKEADHVPDKFVYLSLPTFSLNKNAMNVLTETYRCAILVMHKTTFGEKAYTHKEAWGLSVDAAKKLYMLLSKGAGVVRVEAADNSMSVDTFDANFDGLTMVLNITLNDNLKLC